MNTRFKFLLLAVAISMGVSAQTTVSLTPLPAQNIGTWTGSPSVGSITYTFPGAAGKTAPTFTVGSLGARARLWDRWIRLWRRKP